LSQTSKAFLRTLPKIIVSNYC